MKFRKGALLPAVACLAISGCATQSPDSSTSSPQAQAAPREVPAVRVITDCGACEVRQDVPGMIVAAYHTAAADAGAKVNRQQEALVVIKEYFARDDAARFLMGALAGKDEIKAAVAFQGKTFMVEDYYMNAWQGIDSLATRIGELVFEGVAR